MVGRPRKPTVLHVIDGTARPDRQNRREPKPKPTTRPVCPRHLDEVAKNEWRRVVPELVQLGVLARIDTATLAAYCQNFSRWVAAERELEKHGGLTYVSDTGMIRKHPAVSIAHDAMTAMKGFAAEYGLTPASRARVHGVKDGEEDEGDDDLLD